VDWPAAYLQLVEGEGGAMIQLFQSIDGVTYVGMPLLQVEDACLKVWGGRGAHLASCAVLLSTVRDRMDRG
jgi:hypothetical protein